MLRVRDSIVQVTWHTYHVFLQRSISLVQLSIALSYASSTEVQARRRKSELERRNSATTSDVNTRRNE